MNYVLENSEESSRLKTQDKIKVYNIANDLTGFDVKFQDHILDAGCGAGVISLFMMQNFSFSQLTSCDFSELRVKQAEKYLKENDIHSVKYLTANLEAIPVKDNEFNKIICRFVYEYLPDPLTVTKEFHRVCKVGGVVRLIDLDGVVMNIQTSNKRLNSMLEHLNKIALTKYHLDFYAGRKLFTHMTDAGFKDVEMSVRPMVFQGEELHAEIQNYRERFSFAFNILEDAFGAEAESFVNMYLSELERPSTLLFYNNFIVSGRK